MTIVTAQQMKNIDRRAIKDFGIPGPVLMENAAAAVMAGMEEFFDGLAGIRVGILCGKGNNGGDGLALARRLRIRGVPVRVALLAPYSAVAGEAKVNLSILRKMDVEIRQNAATQAVADVVAWSDIIVDALLGVGLSQPLKGTYAFAVELMNASGKPVVAVDIPTGINADTGAVMGSAVRADLTVTMALLKRGLVLHPGAAHAGTLRVADIGIPPEVIEAEKSNLFLLDRGACWGMLTRRDPDSHKGEFGHLLVIAGSPGKAGAAVMAAQSALRAGAGLVSVAAPNSLIPIIQQQVREAMCVPSAESIDGTIGIEAGLELLKTAAKMTACAIGPGLSTHYETTEMVRSFVRELAVPTVIDADGLNALAGSRDILKKAKAPFILTPHPGEMGRLAGLSAADVQKDRIGIAAQFAVQYRVTLVLKGAGTVIALPDGRAFVNSTGNPGMATGGTGDALTGMIGGLLAQGYATEQAACLGVYLHGLAGDLAAEEKGEAGMIAGDLIEKIPQAMKNTAQEATD
ncbi:MAG TPA: NAD(P)H-hydrate dehydratase [Nitrospirota bacterium]|nr:NAD(P)H-hydrate dehydratase [Nitrospirota bacterium]